MHAPTVAALLLLLLQGSVPASLVGRWDAETRSNGGLGAWLEFAADGTCQQTMGAMVDGTWTADGTTLTLTMVENGAAHAQQTTVTVAGDVLTQTVDGRSRTMARVGAATAGAAPFVGVWHYAHYTGEQAFEEYTADGRFLFRLPMRTIACQWTATTDHVHLASGGQTHDFTWSVDGDRMTMMEKGATQAFRRGQANVVAAARTRP